MTKAQEMAVLRQQAKALEQALEDLRSRIREVEAKPEGSATT